MPASSVSPHGEAAPPTAERTAPAPSDWRQEGWSSPNGWKIRLALLACRYRAVPWVIAWVSAAGAAAMAACRWIGPVGDYCPRVYPGSWWAGFAGWLGIFLISSSFILAISGWFGVRFRYVAWGVATVCGAAVRGLRARWRALLLVVFVLLLVQVDFKQLDALSKVSGWNLLAMVLTALAALVLLALLWVAYQGRNRIILQEIKDHTGRKELKACAAGLSERLCGELAGLAQLYGWINRSQGSRIKDNIYRPAIDVQDAGGLLDSAVSAQATLDLKFLKVPIGAVLALGSRLLRGARIAGSLHEYDGHLLLVAQMTGGGREGGATWRVAEADLDEEDRVRSLPLVLDRMIEQLACRIAADLVSIGSRKWRAVHHFTEGLRAYRNSQGTKNQKLLLHKAEQSFLKALSEDEGFAQCHYNLGIVYREMEGKEEAADAAFRRALRSGAEPSRACYALAAKYFWENRFADALWFSRNAIRILPDEPMAWHLYAMSLYYGRVKEGKPGWQEDWEESLEAEALAVGIAWRDFCRWQMKGRLVDRAEAGLSSSGDHRETAAAFTCSLAIGFLLRASAERRGREEKEGPVAGEGRKPAERGRTLWKGRGTPGARRAWTLIRQSARLAPDDSENYFHWASVLWKTGDLPQAAPMLDRAFAGRLGDEQIDFWSILLAVHAALMTLRPDQAESRDIACDACDYLLDTIAARDPVAIEGLIEPLEEARDRLEQALAWATASGEGGAEAQASRYERLLEDLAWRPGETLAAYSRRLPLALESDPAAEPALHLFRLRNLLLFLEELNGPPELRPSEDPTLRLGPWRTLLRLREEREPYFQARLEALDVAGLLASDEEAPGIGPIRLLQVQWQDWEWACAQVAVRLALWNLEEEPLQAAHCLAEALARLETRTHCHQIVDQRLRSRLAEACLLEAREAEDLHGRTGLLRQAVKEAEKAAALDPSGYEEHKVLGKLYFELGDYQRAEEEWKVCSVVNPDPEVLNLRAEAVWRRGLELTDAQARRQAFLGAIKMFEEARELIEKAPGSSPEEHGKCHFWLGVFHRELLEFDQAIFNHKIAWSLGVRPLEARTSLAWAYLEARMYGEALATFQAVWREARRRLAERMKNVAQGPAAEPGEKMPLDEIVLRILLGRALHDAELGIRLRQAENLIRYAFRYARGVRSYKRAELRARCRECLGLIRLQRYELEKGSSSELEAAVHQLQRALQLHARCDAYLLLARAHLHQAKAAQGSPRKEELETARQDCERARQADLRGRRDREIKDLLRQIEKEGKAAPPAAELRRLESGVRSKPAEAA